MTTCTCAHHAGQHHARGCAECACPGLTADPSPVLTRINHRWDLLLPPHRAYRPQWTARGWERERIDAMASVIRPGHVVYDIGAEEGDMPGLWASWGASVHAFEPNPAVWPNIRAVFAANGLALGGWFVGFAGDEVRDGARTLVEAQASDQGGWPACAHGPVIPDHGFCQLNERPDLPATTLDAYARTSGTVPDVITIDVEGSELRVVRGAVGLLEHVRPHLFVSVHPVFMADQYGDDPEALHGLVERFGYRRDLLAIDHEQHWHYHPRTRHGV